MTGGGFAWGDELPRLAGPRVELRSVRDQDAPALLAVFGDPEVTRFWSSAPLPDLAAARTLVVDIRAGFRERRFFQWGVAFERELIGTCTLIHLDRDHRRAEVGFALRRASWGRGLASEALGVLLGFAFDTLALHRLEADADPKNDRSLRVLERQGFRREGHLRERWHVGGEVQDAVFLGLLRREWQRPGR